MSKKILIFSLTYIPNQISGAETAVAEITDRISRDDYEFHMVTNRYDSTLPKIEQVGNVLVHRIGVTKSTPTYEDQGRWPLKINKPIYQFLAPLKAFFLHRRYKYDAVWVLMAHSAGVPGSIFKLIHPKVKLIVTLQEGDSIQHIESTMKPLWFFFKRAFTKADSIQVISAYLEDWAKDRKATCPIHIIHNAGNPNDFRDNLFTKEQLQIAGRKLGKEEGEIFLVNTARLVPQKAFDVTIQSLPLLPPHVKFLIVGGGSEEQRLKELVKELGLGSRVVFTGAVDRSEVTLYRRISDIFVMPSRSEGLGNAGLSAMASRLPLIATQEGGLAEYVFDKKNNPDKVPTAWVVEKDNPKQIADAVTAIMEDISQKTHIIENARKMVEDEYHWDSVAKKMKKEIFDSVTNKV